MTDDDFRRAIIEQWHDWRARAIPAGRRTTIADAIRFCAHLSRKKSALLDRCPGRDPWQHIGAVLLDAGVVVRPDVKAERD
jgi:hypothetical protein